MMSLGTATLQRLRPFHATRGRSPLLFVVGRRFISSPSSENSYQAEGFPTTSFSTSSKPAITASATHLTLHHPSLQSTSSRIDFPYTWLRDSCQCPKCIHPATRQKLHRTSDIPLDIGLYKPGHVTVEGSKSGDWAVQVAWDRPLFQHDTSSQGIQGHSPHTTDSNSTPAHLSTYPLSFLLTHASLKDLRRFHHVDALLPTPWLRDDVNKAKDLFIPYNSIQPNSETHLKALTQLTKYGVLIITGVPTTPPMPNKGQPGASGDWEIKRVANLFTELRETFYGDIWDVKSLPKGESRNIAYTDLDLDLHMDLMYLVSPPRFQFLHCLRNKVEGGQSLFVDALEAAHELYRTDREAFTVLAETDVGFWYINDGHHLERKHKTFVVEGGMPSDAQTLPRITAINYSPPFQAPLPLSTPKEFYPALQKFAATLRRPEGRWEYLLNEGDVAVFDNRRVLHARKAFKEREGSTHLEGPSRLLKGCYGEDDAVMDRVRVLRAKFNISN